MAFGVRATESSSPNIPNEREIRKWQVYLLCLEFYHCVSMLLDMVYVQQHDPSYRWLSLACLCMLRTNHTLSIWCFYCLSNLLNAHFLCALLTHCAFKSIRSLPLPHSFSFYMVCSGTKEISLPILISIVFVLIYASNVFPVPLLLNNNYHIGIERNVHSMCLAND